MAFLYDIEGQLYSIALKQLFMGVYIMELCLIGLFLSIRDDQDVFTSIDQVIVMMIATTLTIIYQLLLKNIFSSILKYLSIFPKDKKDEEGESNSNHFLASTFDHLRHLEHICYD